MINKHKFFTIIVSSLLVVLAYPGAVNAAEVHFPDYHFSIKIPDGWVAIPGTQLAATATPVIPITPGKVKFIAGYQPVGKDWFTKPYVLLSHLPPMDLDFDRMIYPIARAAREYVTQELRTTEIGRNASLYGPTTSIRDPSILMELQDLNSPEGALNVRQLLFPGSKGIVGLYIVALYTQFETTPEVFWDIQHSVRFDEGYGYSGKRPGSMLRDRMWYETIQRIAPWVLGIAGLFAIIAVLVAERKKKKKST